MAALSIFHCNQIAIKPYQFPTTRETKGKLLDHKRPVNLRTRSQKGRRKGERKKSFETHLEE